MDPDTDVCQTEQPQISYSVDFIAEQSSTMGLLGQEGTSNETWSTREVWSVSSSSGNIDVTVGGQ